MAVGAVPSSILQPPSSILHPLSSILYLFLPLFLALGAGGDFRLFAVLGIDENAVLAQEDEVLPAVTGDVGDDRFARLCAGAFFAHEALGFEDLEVDGMPQAAGYGVVENVDHLRLGVDDGHVGLAVAVQIADD